MQYDRDGSGGGCRSVKDENRAKGILDMLKSVTIAEHHFPFETKVIFLSGPKNEPLLIAAEHWEAAARTATTRERIDQTF